MPNETGAEILARIKPRLHEDWINICLRPDLVVEFEEADAALEDAQLAKGPKRMADGTTKESRRLARVVDDLRKQMDASAVKFVFRALTKDAFRAMCDNHPPRSDDLFDMQVGYDREAVSDALIRASLVEPVFDDASWVELEEVVSIGEWAKMREYAEKVNGQVVTESPKSALASRILSLRASDSRPAPASE